MESLVIKSEIKRCQYEELDNDEKRLIDKAIEATNNSYSPYSNFKVGAAIRLDDGTEIIGANQENAAFGVTLCAERSAIFNAQSNYPERPITHLAIAARNERGLLASPITPCGSCRQVILEIEQRYKRPIKIYLYGERCVYIIDGVRSLLPLSFVDDAMR